jgi:hypothetical protein
MARQVRIRVQRRSDKPAAHVDEEADEGARVLRIEARAAVAGAKRLLERAAAVA